MKNMKNTQFLKLNSNPNNAEEVDWRAVFTECIGVFLGRLDVVRNLKKYQILPERSHSFLGRESLKFKID